MDQWAATQRKRAAVKKEQQQQQQQVKLAAHDQSTTSDSTRREIILTFRDKDPSNSAENRNDDDDDDDENNELVDADVQAMLEQRALRRWQEQRLRGGDGKSAPAFALEDVRGSASKAARVEHGGNDDDDDDQHDDFDAITASRLRFESRALGRVAAAVVAKSESPAVSSAPKFYRDFNADDSSGTAHEKTSSTQLRTKPRAKFALTKMAPAAEHQQQQRPTAPATTATSVQVKNHQNIFSQRKKFLEKLESETVAVQQSADALRDGKSIGASNIIAQPVVEGGAVDSLLDDLLLQRKQPKSSGSWSSAQALPQQLHSESTTQSATSIVGETKKVETSSSASGATAAPAAVTAADAGGKKQSKTSFALALAKKM